MKPRKPWRVHSLDYAQFIDGRPQLHVGLPDGFKKWHAYQPGGEGRELFRTHAEAITYAQREATKAIAAKNQLPPLTQEPTC